MKPSFPPRLLKHRNSGIVRVRIFTQTGAQWISTGQTSYMLAREVCSQAMIEKLQMAASANCLTADAISRFTTGRRFTCADILEEWKADAVVDLAPDTLNAYAGTLRAWMEFAECSKEPLSRIKRVHIDQFVNEAEVSAGMRRGRLAALRSFFKFAYSAGFYVGNPAERVKVKTRDLLFSQLEAKQTIPVTAEEYRTLMESPKVTGFWRVATGFAWWLGLRLRDVACFEWASIGGETIVLYPKKNGRRLELPLSDELIGGGELRRLLLELVEQTPEHPKFCFPKEREIALAPKRRAGLSVTYQRLLRRHGIKGKRFHSLRHSCAVRLKAAGRTLDQIAANLGHHSTETTEIYTNHD